jgi:hypothetical protein
VALEEVTATAYLTPFREGGSMPGLMETDDDGTYVVKFRGAGQGAKVLVSEVIAARLAHTLGLPVPRIVAVHLDAAMAASEPDPDIQDLLKASGGLNLGVDFLPGAVDYDPGGFRTDPALAGRVLWFDALIGNVDRTRRNPNLLRWHGELYLIDHGSSLTFHYNWPSMDKHAERPFNPDGYVLLNDEDEPAPDVAAADAELAPLLTEEAVRAAVDDVPDEWLYEPGAGPAELRERYVRFFGQRLAAREKWVTELISR